MAEAGKVIVCSTVEIWKEQLQKGSDSKKLIVVDFTASWCGPCKVMAPIFADLARKMTDVIFLKVDVDQLSSVAEEWDVRAMPTFIYLKDGKQVAKFVGADRVQLEKLAEKHAAA